MSREDDQHGPCPIQWGDRVDHKLFGFGTVVGEPVPMMGASLRGPPRTVARGWSLHVKWDDPAQAASDIGFNSARSNVLRKVSSPSAKGHAYWESEWRKRLAALAEARTRTQAYVDHAFRNVPPFSPEKLGQLRKAEEEAFAGIEAFLAADAGGEHP